MKRLICCFDGTWNDDKDEEALTNVVKLSRAIPGIDGKRVSQLVSYIVGVGTGYVGKAGFVIGASGIEAGDRVRSGYKFLVDNYQPGDEIYLFGFSRGAFEARSLGGFIALLGIAKGYSAFSLDDAWKAYKTRGKTSSEATLNKLRMASNYPAGIKCIGVWDTVGNLGNPLKTESGLRNRFAFHDTDLSANVDVGLHAVSIDEKRAPFRPILWTLPVGASLPSNQIVEQVWFAGVHADVGGGYKETALSDIGLMWMAERVAATTSLAIDFDYLRRIAQPDPLGMQHRSNAGKLFKAGANVPFVRLIQQNRNGVGALRRMTLGSWRTGKAGRGGKPVNESIHPSALARLGKQVMEDVGGKPKPLLYQPMNLAAVVGAEAKDAQA